MARMLACQLLEPAQSGARHDARENDDHGHGGDGHGGRGHGGRGHGRGGDGGVERCSEPVPGLL